MLSTQETGLCLALTTAGSREQAEKIAHALVEQKLAACVNIVDGVRSVYRWQGKVEEAVEFLLLIKTSRANLTTVEQAVRELHTYDLPEFLVLPVEGGSAEYLEWVLKSMRA